MMEKQTWLIIGASSDVGVSYIKHLADKGTDGLTIYAHCNSRVSRFDEIKKDHPGLDIKVLKADLKLKSDRERLMDEVSDIEPNRFVFLPAAGFEYMRLKDLDTVRLEDGFAVQAESFLMLSSKVLPAMKKTGFGRVAVMLTEYTTDDLPPKFMADYITAKYALLGAMKACAAEYGGDKVKINGISPSMMDTSFINALDEKIKELNRMKAGRLLEPSDLFPVLDELLSAECDKNGCNIRITA